MSGLPTNPPPPLVYHLGGDHVPATHPICAA